MAPFLLPKANSVVLVGGPKCVFVGGVVAATEGAGLDRRASITATEASTPSVATTIPVRPFRTPQNIRAVQQERQRSVPPSVLRRLVVGSRGLRKGRVERTSENLPNTF